MVAIDGTGFSLNHRSPYFCTIAGERKLFLKFNAALNIVRKVFLDFRIRKKQRNENIDVPYLVRQSVKNSKVTDFLADKAYDSEKNHEIAEKYGANFIAPLRKHKHKVPGRRIKGVHRRRLSKNFPKEKYNKRSIIEGMFSAVKRKLGHLIYAKKSISQKNELLFKISAYNLQRIINSKKNYFLQDFCGG